MVKFYKILLICGSSYPTRCGVGKFNERIAEILSKNGSYVTIYSNKNQKLKFEEKEVKKNDYKTIQQDIDLLHLRHLVEYIREYSPNIINIQYNSIEFGRQIFPSFLPIIIKILFPKIKIQVTIHEFSNLKTLGKIRHIIPTLFADRAFFSDQKQLNSAIEFSKGFIKKKSAVMALGSSNLFTKEVLGHISNKNECINIFFHGLIQPKNGIEFLLTALKKIKEENKFKFKLYILGDFKLLIDYGKMTEVVQKYQRTQLNYIEKNLNDEVIICGDIEPSSDDFKKVLEKTELFIFPDSEGITIRRTSFWNVFAQSKNISIIAYDEIHSDKVFKDLITFEPANSESLYNQLVNYSELSFNQKQDIRNQQQYLKKFIHPEDINKQIINLILGK